MQSRSRLITGKAQHSFVGKRRRMAGRVGWLIVWFGIATIVLPSWGLACTTAVISGKATADGRPILWKNRDTSSVRNEVAYFNDGRYRVVAVVNAGNRSSVWMGMNEAGLCIENSLSKDLASEEKASGPGNGRIMKLVLQTCRTVADVERLLNETNRPGRITTANYGVIDAEGGAALFETGPKSFTKFDANDPSVAPNGYLVRSNFATTARRLSAQPLPEQVVAVEVYSGARYARACRLLEQGGTDRITVEFVLRNMTRDLADQAGRPYAGTVIGGAGPLPAVIDTASTISRTTTVSAAIFQGVRRGESPASTTMWALLGDPKFTIAVPCWVANETIADPLEDPQGAELGELARTLRDWSLTHDRKGVRTHGLPGIWEDLWSLENELLSNVRQARRRWTQHGFDAKEAVALHQQSAERAMQAMQRELLQAKQAVLETAAVGDYPDTADEPRIEGAKIRVAIYDHSSGTANGPRNLLRILSKEDGFECTVLHPDQIRQPRLSAFDLIVVPGGSGSLQSEKLGAEGRQAIRQFVNTGGGYLGICAGSYLASSHYSWSLGLINAKIFDRAHWARGTGTVSLQITSDGREALEGTDDRVSVYYGQGPLLLPGDAPDLPAYEPLATYATEIANKGAPAGAMEGTHAIIRAAYGSGRVVCVSPHPETTSGPNWMIRAVASWAAKTPESN